MLISSKKNWFEVNKLYLDKKIVCMIIHHSSIKPNIVIDNHELTQFNCAKYLSVIINQKLISVIVSNFFFVNISPIFLPQYIFYSRYIYIISERHLV